MKMLQKRKLEIRFFPKHKGPCNILLKVELLKEVKYSILIDK